MADRRALDTRHAQPELALSGRQTPRVVGKTALQLRLQHRRRDPGGPPDDDVEPIVGRQRSDVERRPDRRVHVRRTRTARGRTPITVCGLVVDPDDVADGVGAPVEETLPQAR